MFEGQTYSKRTIVEFITTLNGYEDVLNIISKFGGKCYILIVS